MREGTGAIEKTTLANYRSSTKHILRYIHDVPVSGITAPCAARLTRSHRREGHNQLFLWTRKSLGKLSMLNKFAEALDVH